MNLYLRLVWTLLRSWQLPRFRLGDTLERSLRVLPNDLDLNGHMNNGRYLTLLDLALVEYFVRTGFFTVMLRNGWRPMSGGAFISYRRGLRPLQTYTLRFRLEACDAQWNYMRFEFLDSEDKLCAAGYVKGAVVSRRGFVPNADSYAALGEAVFATALPGPVLSWVAAEQAAVQAAW